MRIRPDPRASELRRTGRACLAILVPLLLMYGFVVALDKGAGFAPAYAQEGTTTSKKPGTTGFPGTTGRPPTTTRPPTTEEPTTTTRITTGTIPNSTEEPGTTYMPSTSRAWGSGDDDGGHPLNPPGVNEYFYRNGSRWICRYKYPDNPTRGTYCIDP